MNLKLIGIGKTVIGWLKAVPWQLWATSVALLLAWFGITRWDRHVWNEGFNAGWAQQHRQLVRFETDTRAAAEKAQAENQAHIASVEIQSATITETSQHDLEAQLAAARAAAADYARRLRSAASPANPGSPGEDQLSQAPGAASSPVGTGASSIVPDDLTICAENTVKAQGWQDWYAQVKAVFNADTGKP